MILYLEDEYWGIYCIRPSKDETFVADQFGVDADAVTIIATGRDDTEQQVFDLAAQVEALPTDEASWQWLNETFDVPGFIDYLIPHIYSNNWDGVRTAGQHHSVEGGCRFLGPLYRRKVAVPLQRFRPDDELRVHGFHRRPAE